MHWSGNVAIYLCLICWGATVPLLAKLMTIRNAWTKEVTTLAVTNEENAAKIDDLERQRQELRDAIDVTTKSWGQVWTDREVLRYNPSTGVIDASIGEADNVGQPDPDVKPILTHLIRPMEPQDVKKIDRKLAFYAEDAIENPTGAVGRLIGVVTAIDETDANPLNHELTVTVTDDDGNANPFVLRAEDVLDDEWEYMGRFNVTQLGDRDSQMQPDWLPRPNDLTSIMPQDRNLWNVRFRERMPVDAATLTSEMLAQLHYNDELYNERQTIRDLAQENLQRHQARVAKRMEQLLGTPDGADPGLQSELLDAERERNEGLARLDDLRRRIDAAFEKQRELVGEVDSLATQLPGAGG